MYSHYAQEHFTIVNGRYFWLFVALLAVYLIYSLFDCSGDEGGEDYESCCM
jgi:hypothetical protein